MTPRVGLFGGSFDPVHRAHVALAKTALESLKLDRVLWIPAGQPWQKARAMTPAEHRVAMVRLAIEGEPRFVLEDCELRREGPSYTLDTLRELQRRDGPCDWFLLIGHDQYAGLHTWRGWRELLADVTLAVAQRPGERPGPDAEVRRLPHREVPLPAMDLSATEIRRRAAAGEPFDELVPPAVARYIDRHALYRAATGS